LDLVSPALGLWVKRSALSLGDLKKNTYKSIFRLRTAELSLGSLPSSSPLLHGAQHCLLRNLQVTKGSLGSASATAHRPCLGQRTGPSAPGQMSPMARCSTSAKALEPVHGNSFNLPPLPPPTPINLFTATDVFTTRSKAGGEGGVLGASLTHWCEVCHPPFPVLQPWAGSPRLAGGCRLHGSGAGAQQGAGKRCQNWHWHWEVAPQGVCASPFPRASPRGLSQGFPCMSTSSVAHQLQNAPTVGNNLPETPPVLFPCIAALESGCPHLSLGTQLLLFPLPFHRHTPALQTQFFREQCHSVCSRCFGSSGEYNRDLWGHGPHQNLTGHCSLSAICSNPFSMQQSTSNHVGWDKNPVLPIVLSAGKKPRNHCIPSYFQ